MSRKYSLVFANILGANVANNAASFGVTILFATQVEPSEFGVLGVALTVVFMLALLLDFGTSLSCVRLYNAESEGDLRRDVLHVMLEWRMATLVLLALCAPVLQSALEVIFPNLVGFDSATISAIWGAGFLGLWQSLRALEQAQKRFKTFSQYTYAYAGLRVLSAAVLMLTLGVTPASVVLALYVVPIILLTLWYFLSQSTPLLVSYRALTWERRRNALHLLMRYSAWVAISAIAYGALLRAPQAVLAQRGSAEEVGLYSAGVTFVAVFSLVNDALRTLLLPDVAALSKAVERSRYLQRVRRAGLTFGVGALLLLAGLGAVQYFVLGETYQESVLIFFALGIGVAITIYIGIANIVIHSYGVPRLDAYVNIVRAIILVLLLYMFAESAMAAAIVFSVVLICGETALFVLLRRFDAAPQHTSAAGRSSATGGH